MPKNIHVGWKTQLSKRFSEALPSKLHNKKGHPGKAYRNGAKLKL